MSDGYSIVAFVSAFVCHCDFDLTFLFCTPIVRRYMYVMALTFRPSEVILDFRVCFAMYAAIALKLHLLLCSGELQYRFAFQCDWFIFAKATHLELEFSSFQTSLSPFLQLLYWDLVYCFLVKSYSSNLRFSVIDFFPQKLRPLNLEQFKNFAFSRLFIAIFAAVGLKLGLLFCGKKFQFQFVFQCDWFIFARVMHFERRKI
jgi:hypothetical protein